MLGAVSRGLVLIVLVTACTSVAPTSSPDSSAELGSSPTAAAAEQSTPPLSPERGCAAQWTGIENSPSVAGDYRMLTDVAALAPDDLFAVGSALALHWDGNSWNVADLAADGTYGDILGVTAISTGDAWSVGFTASDAYQAEEQTLALHWDGATWSDTPTPNPSSRNSQRLTSVAAVSSDDVWAVGYRLEGQLAALNQTLIVHWNGNSWEEVPSPSIDGVNNELQAVRAISADDVWAVGYIIQDRSAIEPKSRTLTLHWDGRSWDIVESADVSEQQNQLHDVAAISSSDVWAVGNAFQAAESAGQSLSLHWDGRAWGVVPSPNVGTNSNELMGVAGSGPDDVWAVGYAYDDQGLELHPLALHWTGSSWETAEVPQSGELLHSERLAAAAALGPTDVWAVGWADFIDHTSAIRIKRLKCAA